MNRSVNTQPRRRERGVTLVELLVALVLGLLLTAGMVQVFASNRVTYQFNDGLSRIQENARFSLDHIAYHARMGGYTGCLSRVPIYNNLAAQSNFRDNIERGIEGYEAAGGGWTPALPAEIAAANPGPLPDSDVLVVRNVSASAVSLVPPFTNAAQLFVSPNHDYQIGELLVVTDCQKASIFQVTNFDNTGFNVVHSNAGTVSPGNSDPNWDGDQDYGLGAELSRLQTLAFYVGRSADGRPTLFQLRLQGISGTTAGFREEELAGDIETMQLRYGIDTSGNGAVDRFESANNVTNWSRVVSVEISLLARSAEEYGQERDTEPHTVGDRVFAAANDRRLRQVFTTVIGVRNRLP